MLLLNKKTGRTEDFPAPVAERLLKKKTHEAVIHGETPSIKPSELIPTGEVQKHIESLKESCCGNKECDPNEKCDPEFEIIEPVKNTPESVKASEEPKKRGPKKK